MGRKFAIVFLEDVMPNLEIDVADPDEPPPNPPILGDFRAKTTSKSRIYQCEALVTLEGHQGKAMADQLTTVSKKRMRKKALTTIRLAFGRSRQQTDSSYTNSQLD
jgi:hypothetical protein